MKKRTCGILALFICILMLETYLLSAMGEGTKEYTIGDTWTVDGQWSLTITHVKGTKERNQYSDKKPAAVYIVDYTYTNLGYVDEDGLWDGLYISIMDTVVDGTGVLGYEYPLSSVRPPQETPVGATCKAQAVFGVDNKGLPMKIIVTKRDSYGKKQNATFVLDKKNQSGSSNKSEKNQNTTSSAKKETSNKFKSKSLTADTFEAALIAGDDLTNTTVSFTVDSVDADPIFGFTIKVGDHLHFCSTDNPGVSEGDSVTMKINETAYILGRYIISYELM